MVSTAHPPAKCRYCYLFAPATEHSGWQREAGLLSGLLGLVPGQCQPLEAPVRAPCVAPACGLTQDETCLKTKTGYVKSNLELVKCFWLRQELKGFLCNLSALSKSILYQTGGAYDASPCFHLAGKVFVE